ncbi:MAG: glycosyltransferase [Gammaproteobacteria bacterium]|nr:glycosyltransferase [Gammaproteobacteria bacterium]
MDDNFDAVDAVWYQAAYPDVAAAGMDPVEHYQQYGRAEGRLPKAVDALALDDKLWGGFSGLALPALEALCQSSTTSAIERLSAAWALTRWFASHQDWSNAGRYVDVLQPPLPAFLDHLGVPLLRIEVLLRGGRVVEAETALQAALAFYGAIPDLCLAAANVTQGLPGEKGGDEVRLAWVNRVFETKGLAQLAKENPSAPLDLDNLTAASTPACSLALDAQPTISVIIPVYNAAQFVSTALRSLLAQTWAHLEIIVVDDGSTDNTLAKIQALAREDSRLMVIRQPDNRGAYAARNAGLRVATGEFITTHDADDWSHPQKLEQLVITLLENPELMGVLAHWVRADSGLHFQYPRMESQLIHPSVSTFLFRRRALERLGRWDEARVGADSEYYERMMAVFGQQSVQLIVPDAPLVFARQWADSLTSARATHLHTWYFGLRRWYGELYRAWHQLADPLALTLALSSEGDRVAERAIGQGLYDQVLMADLSDDPQVFTRTRVLLSYLLEAGQRVALFHWPDYCRPVLLPMSAWYLARVVEGRFTVLVPEDAACCVELLVVNRQLLRYPPDMVPRVTFQRIRTLALAETMAYRVAQSRPGLHEADRTLIKRSGLFDADWYARHYPDVCEAGEFNASHPTPLLLAQEGSERLLQHYLTAGISEGRDPGPAFCSRHYLARYPQVEEGGWLPIIHYLKAGARLGYDGAALPEWVGEQPQVAGRPTVLVCGHSAGCQLFGAERSLLGLLEAFAALDFNVLATVPDDGNPAYLQALRQRCSWVGVVPYEQWSASVPPCAWAVERLVAIMIRHVVDVVHVNTIMLREPALAARRVHLPVAVHVHESLAHDPDLCAAIGLSAHEIRSRVLQRADVVVANSAFTARAFYKPGATYRVGNTVDLAALDLANPVEPGRMKVALISSHQPKKGLMDFVALARLLAEIEPGIALLSIGPENAHIKALRAAQPPLPENLTFPGYAETPQAAVSQANVVVSLSHFQETFGLTILEAMAARRPVVVYDWGALPELVRDGVNGFVLPFGDVAGVASRLRELCRDPARLECMGEAGRQRALTGFGLERVSGQLREAYVSILAGRFPLTRHNGEVRYLGGVGNEPEYPQQ